MPSFTIANSIAFVTGTNKKNGIGRAIVSALIENGASKVYATARSVNELEDLVAEYNGKVVAVALDVTNLEDIEKLGERFPDVTLVVNNAGYLGGTSTLDDISIIQKEIQVNYIGPLAIVKSFAKVLKSASTTTAIVNLASIASFVNFPIAGTYSASKAAAHSMTQAQRRDLSGSLVIGVYPGPIDTDMAKEVPMDKVPPSAVAETIVEALLNGVEDVFPDPTAQHLYAGWKADAKALEQQMALSAAESQ